MSVYICTICGYQYDEVTGAPEHGIAPNTRWEDIPDTFSCPLCGATKEAFIQEESKVITNVEDRVNDSKSSTSYDHKELSFSELSAICANLAKGCEKQYKEEEMKLFLKLEDYFKAKEPNVEGNYERLLELVNKNLSDDFPHAKDIAINEKDRGALRALTWSEKVTRILNNLLDNYIKKGDSYLEDKKVFVCEICGFIFIGDKAPDICPICKVPSLKIHEVK